jgi:general stress protein YciG
MKQKITQKERDAYSIVGRYGGKANFKKHGKKHMSNIGKKGANNRWHKFLDQKDLDLI